MRQFLKEDLRFRTQFRGCDSEYEYEYEYEYEHEHEYEYEYEYEYEDGNGVTDRWLAPVHPVWAGRPIWPPCTTRVLRFSRGAAI